MNIFLEMVTNELMFIKNKTHAINNANNICTDIFKDTLVDDLNALVQVNKYKYTIYFRHKDPMERNLHTRVYDKLCSFITNGENTIHMQTVSDANYHIRLMETSDCVTTNKLLIEYRIIANNGNIVLNIKQGELDILLENTPIKLYEFNISDNLVISFYIYNINNHTSLTIPMVNINRDYLRCLLIKSHLIKNKICKKSFVI